MREERKTFSMNEGRRQATGRLLLSDIGGGGGVGDAAAIVVVVVVVVVVFVFDGRWSAGDFPHL